MKLKGKAWKVGDHMKCGGDIMPTEYEHLGAALKYDELAAHVFEHVLPGFASGVRRGDIVVAGENFGSGHGHFLVPAIRALAATGVAACIAKSYSGVYQRMAINSGFPAAESGDAWSNVETGDDLEIDLSTGGCRNLTRNASFHLRPFPAVIVDILDSGGYEAYAVKKLKAG